MTLRASIRVLSALLFCAALAGVAYAEGPGPGPGPGPGGRGGPGPDMIAGRLFPPELIMDHQQELGIDAKQRDAILKEVKALQSHVMDVEWKMKAATETMGKLLEASHIDEARTLAQADRIMGFEHDIKRSHLATLIRIRNLLTDAQRAKLDELRRRPGHPPPGPRPGR